MRDARIETPRLILSPLAPDDAPRVFAYRSDPHVRRFQFFEPETVEDARAFIADGLAADAEWRSLGIRPKDSRDLAGDLGIRLPSDMPRQAEIGVTVAPDRQRQGIAFEALGGLLGYLFGARCLHRVFASIDPRNLASMALFERAGWREEARFRESMLFKGEWADDVVFAMLRSEWEPPERP